MKTGTRLLKIVVLFCKRIKDPYYNGFAAQLAFYYMLALVPIAMLISQLFMQVFNVDMKDALSWLFQQADSNLVKEVESLISSKTSSAFNIVYAIIALWAASRAQFSLTRITNFTITDGRTTGNGYFLERFKSVFTMFLMLLAIFIAVVVIVYGGTVMKFVTNGEIIWLYLRWPVSFLMFMFVIGFTYYIMPIEKVKVRDIIPGTIFASVGLLLVTFLYALYVDKVIDYNIIYGALANIVAIMFWFNCLAWVICMGVMFNKLWGDTRPSGDKSFGYEDYYRDLAKLDAEMRKESGIGEVEKDVKRNLDDETS